MAKVLIIDDDSMMCDMLSDVVRGIGHDVAGVSTLGDGFERNGP